MVLLLIQGLILMALISFNQAADIFCNADEATIDLSGSDMDELGLLSSSDLWYVGSPGTRGVPNDIACNQAFNVSSITIPISSCGGKAGSVNGDDNTISMSWHIRKYTTRVFKRKDACLLVRCLFKVDFNASIGITQILNKYTSTATSAVTDLDVVIETFGSEADRDAGIPIQNSFVVPAKVRAKLRIINPDADPIFSLWVDKCFITPAVGTADPEYSIVLDGAADTAFDPSNYYEGGVEDLCAIFCFDSFAWVNHTINTYVIQCTGVACMQDNNGDCATNPFTRRRRRSTFDERYFEAVSQPLWFINE